jgi:hypothetical protein
VSRPRPTYLAAAGLLVLLLSLAFATVFTRSGPPTCPEGSIMAKRASGRCVVPTDSPGSPSGVKTVAPTRDLHLSRRLIIVGVGVVIGVTLAATAARLSSNAKP